MHTLARDRPDVPAPLAPRIAITALVAIAQAAHLAWEAAHGGIVSHHVLGDPSLPSLWNGWGLVVLPALAWIASLRLFRLSDRGWRPQPGALLRLAGAMAGGIALSVAFTAGRSDLAGYVLLALAVSAVAMRGYRVEYLLGFVLGMTWTFGALIPTIIGGAIAVASAVVWFGLGRGVRRLARARH